MLLSSENDSGLWDKMGEGAVWLAWVIDSLCVLRPGDILRKYDTQNSLYLWYLQGVPKNCAILCGYCGAAVDSVILVFTQLHRLSFNLEFETLFELI